MCAQPVIPPANTRGSAGAEPPLSTADLPYTREVFERLVATLDHHYLNDDTVVRREDELVRPHYELRGDGAWLRAESRFDVLAWTPASEVGRPLSMPAIPFPFAARHLAAFVLAGWGRFLGERHGLPNSESLDVELDPQFLDSKFDADGLEALRSAYRCIANTRAALGDLDAELRNALRATHAAAGTERAAAVRQEQDSVEARWLKAMVEGLLRLRSDGTRTAQAFKAPDGERTDQRTNVKDRRPKVEANAEKVYSCLQGFYPDPTKLPKLKGLKDGSPAKAKVRAQLVPKTITESQFRRAWTWLIKKTLIAWPGD